ncbi:MAG: sulfatase-like hydrolase/transferase [Acidobacteria bacterium]|nr:sulfatase-like hydrolase/transferase [Acidobacteriota bacterium]
MVKKAQAQLLRSTVRRSTVQASAVTLLLAFTLLAPGSFAAERPNVILLLADDLGWGDLGVYGGRSTLTPNLDALAAHGTRLVNYYSTSAVCTPARASLLTGRYPLRLGITKHFPDDESHLPAESVTIAELLQAAGYRTGHVGKWHLGGLHQKHIDDRAHSIPGPHEHGFEEYLTQLEDPPVRVPLGRENRMYRDGGKHLVRNDENVPPDPRYYTDINGDEAIRLVEKFHGEGKPFFLNLWWLVPHKPYEPAPEPFFGMYEGWADGDQRKFRSMLSHMDHKVGELVAKLEELGIADNTLIVFTSDNGGAYEADIGPWKGGKTDLHGGGVRVPYIAVWPGKIPAGVVSREVANHNDLLPTFCAAAGVEPPAEIDGLNLLPHLTDGAPVLGRGPIFWQMDLYKSIQRHYPKPEPYATEAVQEGRWKLLSRDGKPVELFDIDADPQERDNLLPDFPEVAGRLSRQVKAFLAEPRMSPLP